MFIPLIFSMSVLVGLHYFDKAEQVYTWMVNQPLQYYIWATLFLIVVQASLYIYEKLFPLVQGLYRSMSRITSRIDNLSNSIDKSSKDHDSPFKNGGRRSVSTTSKSRGLSNLNNPFPKIGGGGPKALTRILSSRRIKGLFASIVENGSMVSLDPVFVNHPDFGKKLSLEQANEAVASLAKTGLITKIAVNKDSSYRILYQKHGTVSDLISGVGWRIISACFPGKVKFSSRMRLLKLFSGYIFRMYKVNGSTQVVKFLKASQLALQKAISGDKISNLRQLEKSVVRSKLTSSGLPPIIPSRDRKLIMTENQNNSSVIRFWLTLFSIYRVISIPGELKLSTIIAPSLITSDSESVVRQFKAFLKASSAQSMFSKSFMFRKADLLLLEAASSTHKVAWLGYFTNPGLLDKLGLGGYARNLLNLMKQPELRILFDSLAAMFPERGELPHLTELRGNGPHSEARVANPEGYYAGKLSIKEEAAGKLRVFAMVDVWSQTILKPIEQMLAKFLKELPNDGVYNQHHSELRARSKSQNLGCSFGYDLSAATDRLPLGLQSFILDLILPGLGENWAIFLTKRDYYMYLPDSKSIEICAHPNKLRAKAPNSFDVGSQELDLYYNMKSRPWTKLNYKVGQPMGALSSFAMLAVCHHFIVQFAYRLAYKVPMNLEFTRDTWYTNYECTGDDVILFDSLVAKEYLSLMDCFGVPINTTKSVVGTKAATEYLKVTSLNGLNVGAVSWKMFMSGNSLMGRANIIYSFLDKGIIKHNINSWIERVSRLSLYSKFNLLSPTLIAIWNMLANTGIISVEEALKSLINGKMYVFRLAKAILLNADTNKITHALPRIFQTGTVHLVTSKATETVWSFEHDWFKITMWKPLAVFQFKADLDKDAQDLTQKMFSAMIPDGDILAEDFFDRARSGNIHVHDSWTEVTPHKLEEDLLIQNEYLYLYQYILGYVAEKLGRIGSPLIEEPGQIDSALPLLAKQNEELERYNELLQLVERAEIKLDPDSDVPPARVIKPTALKLVKLLRKMGNRPLFTTAASLKRKVGSTSKAHIGSNQSFGHLKDFKFQF
jgi:hypothetical protein